MKTLKYLLVAFISYLVSGLNPAIILSKAIYHQDIRDYGSNNPGFTNFLRIYGKKYAWLVFILDIGKTIALLFLFKNRFDNVQFGVAFIGLIAMLGHIFPIWYGFKGGKGFLVCLTITWFMSPQAGLIATLTMMILVVVTKYMSLSTLLGILIGAIAILIGGRTTPLSFILYAICVALLFIRHRENIKRLLNGTESKTYIFSHK